MGHIWQTIFKLIILLSNFSQTSVFNPLVVFEFYIVYVLLPSVHGLLKYPDGKLPFHVENLVGPMYWFSNNFRLNGDFYLLFFFKQQKFIWVTWNKRIFIARTRISPISGRTLDGAEIAKSGPIKENCGSQRYFGTKCADMNWEWVRKDNKCFRKNLGHCLHPISPKSSFFGLFLARNTVL